MIKVTTALLSEILNAKLIGDATTVVDAINTDSRQYQHNSLFFALKGENFDAHDYLDKAISQGAIAVVVERADYSLNVPQLLVANSRLALGDLAKWLRNKINPRTVAMTGSSGKTTVKEMTASILQQTAGGADSVLFTQGNFNNDIGVPLTLLRLTEQHKFAVIELGANHQGEIDYTTQITQPNAALVNNVAPAHLEGFGSIEGVASAKGEIYRGLTENGVAILNQQNHYLTLWQNDIGCHPVVFFNGGDYWAENVQRTLSGSSFTLHTPQGKTEINLPYLGAHNVSNALAAAALAMNVGASLDDVTLGLTHRSAVKGRLFPIIVSDRLLLLDDTYNANVDSLCAAIDVLKTYSAYRILLVGDMKELGAESGARHAQVGEYAQQAGLDLVLSFGNESQLISTATGGKHFDDKNSMISFVSSIIHQQLANNNNVVVLGKGSRSMHMEDVIYSLKESFKC